MSYSSVSVPGTSIIVYVMQASLISKRMILLQIDVVEDVIALQASNVCWKLEFLVSVRMLKFASLAGAPVYIELVTGVVRLVAYVELDLSFWKFLIIDLGSILIYCQQFEFLVCAYRTLFMQFLPL